MNEGNSNARHVTVDKLNQDEVAQLAYDADITPEEVRTFEGAVAEKMIRCGFTRVEKVDLYLKVKRAVREFQKEMAVQAAVAAFKKTTAPAKAEPGTS
jgi:hypothetical protein